MKKKKILTALLLTVILVVTACGGKAGISGQSNRIKEPQGSEEQKIKRGEQKATEQEFREAYAAFATELLRRGGNVTENRMLSPVSVLCAMTMAANGAEGETLSQMEKVLGGGMDIEDLDYYLSEFVKELPAEKKGKLLLANSIWIKDSLEEEVQKEFIQKNTGYFGAEVYTSPFNARTVKDINAWVSSHTDKMIPNILKEIQDTDMMYLVNGASFEAEWKKTYEAEDIRDRDFRCYSGERTNVKMMHSQENIFLSDGKATGFMKPYKSGYKMAVLLPNEGVDMEEYLSILTGKHLLEMLENPIFTPVQTAMPKFEHEYNITLNDTLEQMGMKTAFDEDFADFSGMFKTKLAAIDKVIHQTKITVDEKGTKAGAATVVTMKECAASALDKSQVVILDRPFVYMIIEEKTNLPVFIGTVMDL